MTWTKCVLFVSALLALGRGMAQDEPAVLAEVEQELVFGPLVAPEEVSLRDGLPYQTTPFDWGVAPLGPMDADACAYACNQLSGKLIWPFEMQVAARPVQRHLIRMGYRPDAVWVDTGKGPEARPLPFDENAKAIRIKRTAYQPMCLCSGAVIN